MYQILEYNYKPASYKFYKTDDPNFPDNLYMGMELEYWRDKKRIDDHFIVDKILPNHFYWKRDGSCDVEMVSQPFNWPYYLKNFKKFDKVFSTLKQKVSKSTRGCGFHVHFSKVFFTKEHFSVLDKFIADNSTFFFKISGRTPASQDRYAYIDEAYSDYDLKFFFNDDKNSYGDKYRALRVTPTTIELRLFKGTLDPKMIHAYLEFYIALLNYTKTISLNPNKKISIKSFNDYVCKNYNLACYLLEKRWQKKVDKRRKQLKVK